MGEITKREDTTAVVKMIEAAAANPDIDVAKLEKMLDMQERILDRQAETDFNAAMSAAQSEIGRVSADAVNPQTRSKYASYAALDKALRPIYTSHGFAVSFDTADSPAQDCVRVLAYVSHRGGHTRTYHVDVPADGKGIKGNAMMTRTHAAGSAMSYGMRYLLKLIFNVAVGEDDDDGNSAAIPRVNEEQAANIRALISEVGADEQAFLKWLKADSVEHIQAAAYEMAVKALERKRKMSS